MPGSDPGYSPAQKGLNVALQKLLVKQNFSKGNPRRPALSTKVAAVRVRGPMAPELLPPRRMVR